MSGGAAFDHYAESYDAALNRGLAVSGESKDYFVRARLGHVASQLAARAWSARRILDYGCGAGDSAYAMFEHFDAQSVVGVDASSATIAVARRDHARAGLSFEALGAPPPGPAFDLAYCNGVFHHIQPGDRPAALAYIHDRLAPGGFFAFWENNPWNPGTRLVMHRIPFDRDAQTIAPTAAARMLRAAGFQVLTVDFLFFFPRALALLRPLEQRLHGVPLGAQYMVLCRKPR
jgi:SAM-dependent methyltransferase